MRRFFVTGNIDDGTVLAGDNHRHLSFVLRAKKGDLIVLCNGDGYDYTAQITDIKSAATYIQVVSREQNKTEPSVKVSLFFGALKGDKNDLVVQKATELGVCEIFPMLTKNAAVKRESVKTDRLNKIAGESCKQCKRAVPCVVYEPIDIRGAVGHFGRFDTVVFPYEVQDGCAADIKSFLSSRDLGQSIAVVIGSEGGFTRDEAELICSAKAKGASKGVTGAESGAAGAQCDDFSKIIPVTLGSRILRAETAAICVVTLVMYEAGELK